MRKLHVYLLTTTFLMTAARAQAASTESMWDMVTNPFKTFIHKSSKVVAQAPVGQFLKSFGHHLDVTANPSLATDMWLATEAGSLRIERPSFNTQEGLLQKELERGLAGRYFGYEEAKVQPSIAALSAPFLIGKGVQTAVSFIPGMGAFNDSIGRGAGKGVQFVLRDIVEVGDSHYRNLSLTQIEEFCKEVSKGVIQIYSLTLPQLDLQSQMDFIHYLALSILDQVDKVLSQSKGILPPPQEFVQGIPDYYLNLDHGIATLNTIGRALKKKLTFSPGLGSETVGAMSTTPIVLDKGIMSWDLAPLDTKRKYNGRKRGRLKSKRSLTPKVLAIREVSSTNASDPTRFKPLTPQELRDIQYPESRKKLKIPTLEDKAGIKSSQSVKKGIKKEMPSHKKTVIAAPAA